MGPLAIAAPLILQQMHPRRLAATTATSHEENHAALLAGKEALAKGKAILETAGKEALAKGNAILETAGKEALAKGNAKLHAQLTGTSCDGATPKKKRRRIAVTGTGCEGASSQPATDASQPATDASPSAGTSLALSTAFRLELAEAQRKHPYVTLWGALHGDRWCFPGVGRPPGFLVPVHKFLAEGIVGRYLVKLTWQKEEGWAPLRDETEKTDLIPKTCVRLRRQRRKAVHVWEPGEHRERRRHGVYVFRSQVSACALRGAK